MKNKQPDYGSPWTKIDAVELFLKEEIQELRDKVNELTGHMMALDKRIVALETPPEPKKPSKPRKKAVAK